MYVKILLRKKVRTISQRGHSSSEKIQMKGKTQMKIAMIGHKDFPSRSGGVEVVVYELSTRLAARGHEVTVYNRGRQKGHNVYQERNVRVKRVFTFKSRF